MPPLPPRRRRRPAGAAALSSRSSSPPAGDRPVGPRVSPRRHMVHLCDLLKMAVDFPSVCEAWIFAVRSALENGDSTLIPPLTIGKHYTVTDEGRIKNRTSQKTLEEDAIKCGLGHWFPKPIIWEELPENTRNNVPSLFSRNGGNDPWHELMPACAAAVTIRESKVPLAALRAIFAENKHPSEVAAAAAAAAATDLQAVAQLLHSPRWLYNTNAISLAYGTDAYGAAKCLLEAVKLGKQEDDQLNVDAMVNAGISPVICLLAIAGCIKDTVWTKVTEKLKEKAAQIDNYDEKVYKIILAKLKTHTLKNKEALRAFITDNRSAEAVAVKSLVSKLSAVVGIDYLSFKDGDEADGTEVKREAAFKSTALICDLVTELIGGDGAVATIWDSLLSPAPVAMPASTLLSQPDNASNEVQQLFQTWYNNAPPTVTFAEQYATRTTSLGQVPPAMRFEGGDSIAIILTFEPRLSAFRLHSTRDCYAPRYSRWIRQQ